MNTAKTYDMIVVGSGNGACGFLSHYQNNGPPSQQVLVIEEGNSFFSTSDLTHQNNWTKAYAEGSIFKLHNTRTLDDIPIISGRACAMGGGGSINYTMIHESSDWLAKNIGHSVDYWDQLKTQLNQKFALLNPKENLSQTTEHILDIAQKNGFELSSDTIGNIPNYQEGNTQRLFIFPTQFNSFGQRTHSGVSLVDWSDHRLDLKVNCRVEQLEFSQGSPAQCVGVRVKDLETGKTSLFALHPHGGKVILCAGAASPRLLMPYRQRLNNPAIGQSVNDHVLLPLGLYFANQAVIPQDVYVPVFATTLWETEQEGQATVGTFDFFAGNFERLLFLLSHLYLAFLLPNWLKRIVLRTPWLFTITKNGVRVLIQGLNCLLHVGWSLCDLLKGKGWTHGDVDLVTAIIKFPPAIAGHYVSNDRDDKRIALGFFAEDGRSPFNQDKAVATTLIQENLAFINELGTKPPWLVRLILGLLTGLPYEPRQVERYVEKYSRRFLLSEQHLAGGCLFGQVLNSGQENASDTGKVKGTANVHVADLSSVPLPRMSPQMTAYLIGFFVSEQLFGNDS